SFWSWPLSALPETLGALRESPFGAPERARRSVKDELRQNLLARLACGDALPIIAGSEVNDNPFAPISKYARLLLAEAGEDTPIAWLDRSSRYVEKLAAPDVTIA